MVEVTPKITLPKVDTTQLQSNIAEQKNKIKTLTDEKEDIKKECSVASEQEKTDSQTLYSKKGIFNLINFKYNALTVEILKLQEEKQQEINKAKEKAQKEGKTDEEIAKIVDNIESSYGDKIRLAQLNSKYFRENSYDPAQACVINSDKTHTNSIWNRLSKGIQFDLQLSKIRSANDDLAFLNNRQFMAQAFNNSLSRNSGFDQLG